MARCIFQSHGSIQRPNYCSLPPSLSLKVERHLLQQRLEEGEEEREDLQAAREREKELSQQLQLLSEQLVESKRHHTPVSCDTHTLLYIYYTYIRKGVFIKLMSLETVIKVPPNNAHLPQ